MGIDKFGIRDCALSPEDVLGRRKAGLLYHVISVDGPMECLGSRPLPAILCRTMAAIDISRACPSSQALNFRDGLTTGLLVSALIRSFSRRSSNPQRFSLPPTPPRHLQPPSHPSLTTLHRHHSPP